jgi:chromosome segregation ATPase
VQLEAEIQSLRRKVEAFEGENRQLRARVLELEASLEGGANLLKELAQAKERCEDLECSVAILTDGNSSLGKRLDVAEAEKAALLRSLDEALVAIARLQAGHASTS